MIKMSVINTKTVRTAALVGLWLILKAQFPVLIPAEPYVDGLLVTLFGYSLRDAITKSGSTQ